MFASRGISGRFIRGNQSNKKTDQELFRLANERFWQKAVVGQNENDCWAWKGSRRRGGYGNMSYNGQSIPASRFSYLMHNGYIDETLFVLHHCDNAECTNPLHLYQGTLQDNATDAKNRGRLNPCRGELSKQARLTEDIVKEIIAESATDATKTSIAKKFNITRTHLYMILNKKRWAHIS